MPRFATAGSRTRWTALVTLALLLLWIIPFLPGRLPGLPYSFPPSLTDHGDGQVTVSVPDTASDGTQWRLDGMLGSSPGRDRYRLIVRRWLASTARLPGEAITIEGTDYLVEQIVPAGNRYEIWLRRQAPQ